jgi:galactose-6-phosphate isomerase
MSEIKTIAIGCDHIVTNIKDEVKAYLEKKGYEVLDCGTYDFVRTHYPIFGRKVGQAVVSNKAQRGIVLCGTGVGISNAANKVQGIRAVLARDIVTVKAARENLDVNVLAFGGRITGVGLIEELVDAFLETEYESQNDEIIARLNAMAQNPAVLEDESLFESFLEKWDRGEYHD